MEHGLPLIELRICLQDAPELAKLTSALTAIDRQFAAFIERNYPQLRGAAHLKVKEIRKGSTIVELFPAMAPLIANIDTFMLVDDFVRRYGGAIKSYSQGLAFEAPAKSDVKDFLSAVQVVANDPDGTATISSASYHETKTTKRVEFKFNTEEAKQAKQRLERQAIELDSPIFELKENVLLVFWGTNKDKKEPGQRTGLRAIVEAVQPKPLPVVYATDTSRERIQHEIGAGDRNIYKLGFYVDCYVERSGGKNVAYKIVEVVDIIDLPGDGLNNPDSGHP